MKKFVFKQLSGWLSAFIILAVLFLAVGLGTLGSAASTGDGFVLNAKKQGDEKDPCIVVNLSEPGHDEEEHVHRDLYIKEVYLNIGTIYAQPGTVATIRIGRGTSAAASYYNYADLTFANFYENVAEGKESVNPRMGALYNWTKYEVPGDGWHLTTYPYYRILSRTCSVLINEIVFVATDQGGTGDPVILTAKVHSSSILAYDTEKGETSATAVERASAVVDAQRIPDMAESSYYRFGEEETYMLNTIAEMKRGKEHSGIGTYNLDGVYNVLGVDLVALGTAICGVSPFGLRLMPMLFTFIALIFGFLFVRDLTGSEKAGFYFAVIFALSGITISLAHFGTPIMIGVAFLLGALYFAFRFFRDGMKRANLLSALPVALAGLFSAAAICVNGAFVLPVLGIVGLVAAGVVHMRKERRAVLDAAIDEAEAEEREKAPAEGEPSDKPTGRQKVASVLSEYRFRTVSSVAMFAVVLVLGTFLIAALSSLPLYYTLVKRFDNPAMSTRSVFYFLWKAFEGGFAGSNVTTPSPWNFFYVLFRGTGDVAAVTATGSLIAIAAIAAGIAGAVFSVVRLVRRVEDQSFREELVPTIILLIGVILGLVTASFAKGGLAFLFLSFFFLFVFAARAATVPEEGRTALVRNILTILFFAAIVAVFALFFVFTFSVPTAGFLSALAA